MKFIRVDLFSSSEASAGGPALHSCGENYQEKREYRHLRVSSGVKSRELGCKLELMRGLG